MTVEYHETIWTVVLTDLYHFRGIFFIRDLVFLNLELRFSYSVILDDRLDNYFWRCVKGICIYVFVILVVLVNIF